MESTLFNVTEHRYHRSDTAATRDEYDFGVKFFVDDGSWLLVRLSGTEPLIRVYAETRSKDEIKPMLDAGERMVEGGKS